MAEQEILPCPMPGCGGDCNCIRADNDNYLVWCRRCNYHSCDKPIESKAITAHNTVSRNNAAAEFTLKALEELRFFYCGSGEQRHTEAYVLGMSATAILRAKGEA